MDWASVMQGLFAFMGLAIAGWVARSLDRMRDSVDRLNIQIAVVIEQQTNHERRITKLEDGS